jgi:phosphoribosylamine--glycine ligase
VDFVRFFLISGDGDGLGIARRLVDEGHDVTVQIRNPKARHDYDNLLTKVDKLPDVNVFSRETTFVFDSTGGGKTAERFRSMGFPVIGASSFAQQLEMDRHLALDLMKDSGIQVPPSQHFMDWESGKKHVETKAERMVYKSDDNGGISYVSSGVEDMVEFLKLQESQGEKPDYELQDFVKGLEISTEVWFDGVDYAPPANHTFEKKQLMNGDLGPSSGCAGNVVWACTEPYCGICESGIKRFLPMLQHHGYRGMIDLNAIVNAEGVWGLEWTPRFGFDAFPAFMEMMTEGVGDTLAKYARGERVTEFPISKKGFAAGIRLTVPPYPFEHKHDVIAPAGVRIRNLVRSDREHSYFYNVLMDDAGALRTSGGFGAVACFTGFGDTIDDALGKCEEICKRVEVKDKQYRTDLAQQFDKCYGEFKEIVGVNQEPKEIILPVGVSPDTPVNSMSHEGQPVGVAMPGYDGQPRDGMLNRRV